MQATRATPYSASQRSTHFCSPAAETMSGWLKHNAVRKQRNTFFFMRNSFGGGNATKHTNDAYCYCRGHFEGELIERLQYPTRSKAMRGSDAQKKTHLMLPKSRIDRSTFGAPSLFDQRGNKPAFIGEEKPPCFVVNSSPYRSKMRPKTSTES